jgi:hypothetical protein
MSVHLQRALGAIIAAIMLPSLAAAQGESSVYTNIDEACARRWLPDEPVMEIACAGAEGWSLYVLASDHGQATAYASPDGVRSDWTSPPTRSPFGDFHDVVEWRVRDGAPMATIHRYRHHTPADAMEPGSADQTVHTLVVTALDSSGEPSACPVAFVNASAITNANEVARFVADNAAPGWDCAREPMRIESAADAAIR